MLVAQSRLTLFVTPWTVAHQAPFVHSISQARILEWVAIFFSRGSSLPGIELASPALAGGFFTMEPPGKPTEGFAVRLILVHICTELL